MHPKYIEFAEYITPDGIHYRFHNAVDRFLLSTEGEGMPPIDYVTQVGPGQHGETVVSYTLAPRIIQYSISKRSSDRTAYWSSRTQLIDMLRPNRQAIGQFLPGHLRRYLPGGKIRDIDVFIEQGPLFPARSLDTWKEVTIEEVLRFRAPDPTFYDPTEICIQFTLGVQDELIFYNPVTGPTYRSIEFYNPVTGPTSQGLLFAAGVLSASATVVYDGDWPTFPSFEIVGPINGFTITNETTGEGIVVNYLVAVGETITISLAYGNKQVVSSLNGNIIGTVSTPTSLATFHLEPNPGAAGGVNVISVAGPGVDPNVTVVNMTYHNRYIALET